MRDINGSKHKLVKLVEIFEQYTDEDHPITMSEIITKLQNNGIPAERKSLYTDINFLKDVGYDIQSTKGRSASYFLASRNFELAELKLLVDAVHSSRFITSTQSQRLIKKLTSLTNVHRAKELNRQIYTTEIPKSLNTSVLYTVDELHRAINHHKQISFKYYNVNVFKEKEFRKDGEVYVQSPIALCWNNDKYYAICFNSKYGSINHYRVDRMEQVSMIEEPWDERAKDQNVDEHIKSVFGMYSGELIKAVLEFDNELVSVVADKFGVNIPFVRKESSFQISVPVSNSPVFLSWLFQLGSKAKIISPESLKNEMKDSLSEIYLQYQDN